ncbi:hypothetical protein CKO31_18355 [Thiohalocapsa halophila]|uniref:SRPBCC domain-containing protein n=1 Tax=Thiohalocapsa halophila TaxID=69359 RepID=A0ABS1CLG0_9GAMM|nr:hypothetical protein [Thiohalocapsa halophila]MBK1632669.1 hypothetical protein [Thiohalocapsa halophila]
MEFFATAAAEATETALQRQLTIGSLAEHCASIDAVLRAEGENGEIWSLWGQFQVHREPIRGGVRFTLPRCPNALAWTITAGTDTPAPVVVHCTINRTEHDPDFIESIELFVDDWRTGLERLAAAAAAV